MVQLSRAGVWKCVLQDSGGQFVMISGMIETQLSSAGSLDTMTVVSSLCLRGCVIRVLPRIRNTEEGKDHQPPYCGYLGDL